MIPECHDKKQPWETRQGLGQADFGGWIYLYAFGDLIKLLEGKIEDSDFSRNSQCPIGWVIWSPSVSKNPVISWHFISLYFFTLISSSNNA